MKKAFMIILLMVLAVALAMLIMSRCNPKQAEAELFLDFGYNNIEGITETQNVYLGLEFNYRQDSVGLDVTNELYRSRTDDELDNHRLFNDVQVSYFLSPEPYVFANIETLTDRASGIDDELSYGLGAGWDGVNVDTQAGLYGRSTDMDTDLIGKAEAMIHFDLLDNVTLIQDYSGDVDMDEKENYRLNGEVMLRIALSNNLSLKTGVEINYVNQPICTDDIYYTVRDDSVLIQEGSKSVRKTTRYFSGISLEF